MKNVRSSQPFISMNFCTELSKITSFSLGVLPMDMIVCSQGSMVCIMHHCQNCPGLQPLKEFLLRELYNNTAHETKQTILFKQWSQTHQCGLISRTENILSFREFFCELDTLTSHLLYIAKVSSQCLKADMTNMNEKQTIASGHKAKNFVFNVQDDNVRFPLKYIKMYVMSSRNSQQRFLRNCQLVFLSQKSCKNHLLM